MFYCPPRDIRVSVDVGCKHHQVAVGLSDGQILEEFSISHQPDGFALFFERLSKLEKQYQCSIRVAMEGYNGYARPLDRMILARGWQLYNINNLKLRNPEESGHRFRCIVDHLFRSKLDQSFRSKLVH